MGNCGHAFQMPGRTHEKASSARMLAGTGRGEWEPQIAQLMALRKLGKRKGPETTNNQESWSPLKEQHKYGLSKNGEGKTNKHRSESFFI